MTKSFPLKGSPLRIFFPILAFALASSSIAVSAQVVPPPYKPVIGRDNTFSADPTIPRPDTPPCTVPLFTNLEFADFNTKNFTYTPPKNCPGPWAKVILKVDFTVTAGIQYDRTAQFFLGGANIFFGTTAEPRDVLSPSWHVENDVTDLSAILAAPQAGTAILGNYVGVYQGVDYNGIIYSNASLVFFPETPTAVTVAAPDVVIGIPGNGGAATLSNTASQLTQSVTLPTNVEKLYLDVIAQSQSNDEFWYLCVPNDVANELESCGGTGFRETEVSVDGVPAGVAPVYPWIFTGGIDPYLWEPIPGVQTLNFKPFRVNLTPFAGLVDDGKPHTIALSVYNADSYFAATATLLAYTDKGKTTLKGSVLSNTLTAAPTPKITENLAIDSSGDITGPVKVSSNRQYSIVGTLATSHGVVNTRVDANISFANTQTFVIDETEYKQSLVQSTDGTVATTTTTNGANPVVEEQVIQYPFTFLYDQIENADGTFTVVNNSDQKYLVTAKTFDPPQTFAGTTLTSAGPNKGSVTTVSNEVSSQDDLFYDASGNYTGHSGNASQTYLGQDSAGYCYSRTLTAKNLAIRSDTLNAACATPATKQ
jgi:hypothetical protein